MPEMSIQSIMKQARENIIMDQQEEERRAKKLKENENQSINGEEVSVRRSDKSQGNKKADEVDISQNFAYLLGYELCRAYTKNTSDHKKSSKRKRQQIVDSDDEDTDDRTEAHVVCLNCGHYNQKDELMCRWISCLMCNNWYHVECTVHWNKSEKEMEELEFICNTCT